MLLGIPARAGLSVLHGFVPPHPGPLAAIGILHGNVGITLALGLLVAVPSVVVAGPLFARLAATWVPIGASGAALAVTGGSSSAVQDRPSDEAGKAQDPTATRSPTFTWTLITVLSPVVLMLLKAAADVWMSKDAALFPFLEFIGDPVVALLIAVLLAMYTFGTAVGFTVNVLSKKIGESLLPIVGVLLIVGAGGGFKQVLVDGGTGTAIAKIAIDAGLSALFLGWIVAVLIRLATGLNDPNVALVVLAIGAGSLFFSHVNDAGFWLVKEYFGLTVGQTIKTWSVMETIISIIGLAMTLLLSLLF
jgi:GntP family gluconate:H+ symporter